MFQIFHALITNVLRQEHSGFPLPGNYLAYSMEGEAVKKRQIIFRRDPKT